PTVTFSFTEAPTDFSLAHTSAVGGTLSNLASVDATHYTATFTAAPGTDIATGAVSVDSTWHEASGNLGTGSTATAFVVDTVTPTAAVAVDSSDVNVAHGTATVTFSFTEAPTDFSLAHTSAVGGTLSNLASVDATHYTATFTAAPGTDIATGAVSVDSTWHEASGNLGTGSTATAFVVDTVTPTAAVAVDSSDVNVAHGTATVTFSFTEAPTDFSLAHTSAVGGTLSNLASVDATHYTATFTAAPGTDIATGAVSVDSTWHEASGNLGTGSTATAFVVDTVTPTAAGAVDSSDGNVAHGTATVTFSFTEAPTDFSLAHTSAVGGTLSNLASVDATHYTATFTAAPGTDIATGAVSVDST